MIQLKKIIDILNYHKTEIFENYNLKELGIFGSMARGENNDDSDIDMIVEYNSTPDLLKYIELENHIEHLLKIKVELVIKKTIRPELKKEILREVIYI